MANDNYIRIDVELDSDSQPKQLFWDASGSNINGKKEAKAFLLKVYDKEEAGTLSIDLWTKDFMVEEMNQLIYESIMTMAETFKKSTKNEEAYSTLINMGQTFIKQANNGGSK